MTSYVRGGEHPYVVVVSLLLFLELVQEGCVIVVTLAAKSRQTV